MIKRIIFLLLAFMSVCKIAHAQDNVIQFRILPVESKVLTPETAEKMEATIRKGLGRSEAVTDSPDALYGVRPCLLIDDIRQTEGLVREISTVSGDLTLEAVNLKDGTVYHTVTIPLKTSAAGGEAKAVDRLASSLKPTDTAFVRFVRLAREKIIKSLESTDEKKTT